MLGKPKSKSHKLSLTGLKRSDETKRRISDSHKNRPPMSDETKLKHSQNMRKRNKLNTFKRMSYEITRRSA